MNKKKQKQKNRKEKNMKDSSDRIEDNIINNHLLVNCIKFGQSSKILVLKKYENTIK